MSRTVRDTATGVEVVAIPAVELRLGDLVGPGCSVIEVRRLAPLRLLVRTSTGHADLVPPGKYYHVAADRPDGPPALEPGASDEGVDLPWYCGWCDTVTCDPHHRHSLSCALAQDDMLHPYDPRHP